ncbi:Aldo ket red domain containing protein, partial [Asbolus verrucosus]
HKYVNSSSKYRIPGHSSVFTVVMGKVTSIKLNNGLFIPALGLGTWQGPPGKEAEVGQAVRDAIDVGYRHFDCAHLYGNEKIIGEAIQAKIKEGVVKRKDLFIVSKLWNTFHRPDLVEPALKETLKNLQLDYLDLYLVHWPHAFKEGPELLPIDPKTGLFIASDVDFIDTWKAMEEVNKKGLTKSIGVSNFNSKQLEKLLKSAKIVPVTNQIECHPYLNQSKLRSPSRPWQKPGDPDVINDPKIKEIGNKYGKSPAQILLRYNVQLGNSVIPKSSNKKRLIENMDIFDFELSENDMKYIDTFDCNGRICPQADQRHIHIMTNVPLIKLNNGITTPALGLGTFQGPPGREAEAGQAVKDAIDVGYRHFDCAHFYGNEDIIGDAIRSKIDEGVVKREDLFIVSKLWNTLHRPAMVESALKETLKNLQLDYLDLYLMHWPQGFKEGPEFVPTDPETGLCIPSDIDYVDTWKAMEELQKKGLTRSLGISNFNSKQIERLSKFATIVPVTNQVECHPYLNQAKLRKFCLERGIVLTSYCPLGSPERPWQKPGDPYILNDPKIKEIARKYGKSSAQIMIKYNLQLGNIVIPKSSNKNRLIENISVFDFELNEEDMEYINTFDCNGRICLYEECVEHPYYPFKPGVEF